MTQNGTIARSDRVGNSALIVTALAEFQGTNRRLPTQEELAARTGLSRTTIQRHLRDLDFGEAVAPLRLYLQDVLLKIAEEALAGNMRAAKLYLQVGWGWSEKDPSKLLPPKEKPASEYVALYEGRKMNELTTQELEDLGPLIHEHKVSMVGDIFVSTDDPRYQQELHEQYRASLEKNLDDGNLTSTLLEIGYRLEPLDPSRNVPS